MNVKDTMLLGRKTLHLRIFNSRWHHNEANEGSIEIHFESVLFLNDFGGAGMDKSIFFRLNSVSVEHSHQDLT